MKNLMCMKAAMLVLAMAAGSVAMAGDLPQSPGKGQGQGQGQGQGKGQGMGQGQGQMGSPQRVQPPRMGSSGYHDNSIACADLIGHPELGDFWECQSRNGQ